MTHVTTADTEARLLGPVTPEELTAFVAALSARINAHGRAEYPTCPTNWRIVEAMPGTKFVRLVSKTENPAEYRHESAYCFIDLSNGDILKTAGWKAPAKHARGNIRIGGAENWWNDALTPYGAAYLK